MSGSSTVWLLILVMGSASACHTVNPHAEPENPDVAGTYAAVSIDGHDLPFATVNTGKRQEVVVSSVMTLRDDGTVLVTMHYACAPQPFPPCQGLPSGTAASLDVEGTWARTEFGLTMDWEMLPTWKGESRSRIEIDGRTLSMHTDENVVVYEKIIENGEVGRAYRAWGD